MKSLDATLARIVASALFTAVLAASWDAWWHGAVGRDSFWEPPHLLLYSAIVIAIGTGIYGWRKTKDRLWGRLAIILSLILVAAPFDELWHRAFGVEDLSSPLIVWSPPHVVLILAILGSFILLLPVLKRDKDPVARRFFGAVTLAGVSHLLIFLFAPIYPTGGWQLLGFYGSAVIAFVIVLIYLKAFKWIKGLGAATLVALFILSLNTVGIGKTLAPGTVIAPHEHPPAWLLVFSFLLPAIFIDLSKGLPTWLRGAIAAFLWAGVLFGFSSFFFQPEFQYSLNQGLIAIIAATVGGSLAGILMSKKVSA